MPRPTTLLARAVGTVGLAAIAGLHTVWATGSPWPAKNPKRLARAVVGQDVRMPSAAPTAIVAAGSAAAALVTSGALGDRPLFRICLRALAAAMLLRAILGGDAALTVLGLPPAGATFRRLDRRAYRPFAGLLGAALWFVAGRRGDR